MFLDPFPNVKGSMCHAGLKKKPNIAMENGPGLKMYFLLNMGIFHCYVSLPEGTLEFAFFFFEVMRI